MYNLTISQSKKCLHDSNIGYEADFSVDGDVDGWTYYDGIYAYGCWNSFLFGTLYDNFAVIGREYTFAPIPAEDYYNFKIVMQLSLVKRPDDIPLPKYGKIMWRTIADSVWSEAKSCQFKIQTDKVWNTYEINMGSEQWWQGDINDIKVYPIFENGRDGDEFFIRTIRVLSKNKHICNNFNCDYYINYETPCPGIGKRGYIKSMPNVAEFEIADGKKYTIESGVNDFLLLNINGYGYETLKIDAIRNVSGKDLSLHINKVVSRVNIGGYAECEVEYTDRGEFVIFSGTYADDSTVGLADTALSRYLKFFHGGEFVSELKSGEYPASGFRPFSSFRADTSQVLSLLDRNDQTGFSIDPFIYNVEGGRSDWLETGLGRPDREIGSSEDDSTNLVNRFYNMIANAGKTIIDFNHPFNASGRIKKVYAAVTLDNTQRNGDFRGAYDSGRQATQLSGACIMFFRPLKNGNYMVLDREITISNRDHASGKLYSTTQEYVEIDCDVFVNKGDYIGVYNANLYTGRTVTESQVDALYFQVEGKPRGEVEISAPEGNGHAGLMLYARSDQMQNRLVLRLDLGHRTNVTSLDINAVEYEEVLEYNMARCLDIDWAVDLFGEDHTTGYVHTYRPLVKHYFNHPNKYYGKNCLNDGIKVAPDGLTSDSFKVSRAKYYTSFYGAVHRKDGGDGVIPVGAKYFQVNGDSEWLRIWLHPNNASPFASPDFKADPIAFTLVIPHGKEKSIHKSKIYFKERFNFRSFALSLYRGEYYTVGNADDPRFELVPNRTDSTVATPWTKVVLDGYEYVPEDAGMWKTIDLYLQNNPAVGHPIHSKASVIEATFHEEYSYFDELGGLDYYAVGMIQNNEQFIQATMVDWSILEHQWPPQMAKGFRFYCNYHESAKICEFEVFGIVENLGSVVTGSVNIAYSAYGEDYVPSEIRESSEKNVYTAYIGDTPGLIDLEITPITKIGVRDLFLRVSSEDVYVGKKGCNHMVLPSTSKRGTAGDAGAIQFKNVYGRPYNLYVDIYDDRHLDERLVYYNKLNNNEAALDPEVGPDSYYKKHNGYVLENYDSNVAINCPVYVLKNLIEGAKSYYSHDDGVTWEYWGELSGSKSINFKNLPNTGVTTLNLPVLSRSKWWKIGFYDRRVVTKVYEIRVFYHDEEIDVVNFYHHKGQSAIEGGNSDTAPHLHNGVVDGSYYVLKGDNYIGFELPDVMPIDKIVFYHEYLQSYENSHDKAGIDSSTGLCIFGTGDHYQTDNIVDMSYFEHDVSVVGEGVYTDEEVRVIDYSFEEDFSYSGKIECNFTSVSGVVQDMTLWTDLVNLSVIDDRVSVTNSGISGNATTSGFYSGEFDTTIDMEVPYPPDQMGWGAYFYVKPDEYNWARIGRAFSFSDKQILVVDVFDYTGLKRLKTVKTSENSFTFRINRNYNTTSLHYLSDDTWIKMADTNIPGLGPVKFGLAQEYTPLSYGQITTAYFDNFYINNNPNWKENLDGNSSFEFVHATWSGTSATDYLYYNISTTCIKNPTGYRLAKVFDVNREPIDSEYAFVMEFIFKADEFKSYTGASSNGEGVSVGVLGRHVRRDGHSSYYKYFSGAQVVLRRDNIGIGIRNTYAEGSEAYAALNTTLEPYFCRFTSDGGGEYRVEVWTGSWDVGTKVVDLTHFSSVKWVAGKVGVGSAYSDHATSTSTGTDYSGRAKGRVAALSFMARKNSTPGFIDRSSVKFSGSDAQYLLVKYENSVKCNLNNQVFDLADKKFTLDFFIKFTSLPVDGQWAEIISSWDANQPITSGTTIVYQSSWNLLIQNVGTVHRLRLIVNKNGVVTQVLSYDFNPDLERWYHVYICRFPVGSNSYYINLLIDGHCCTYASIDSNIRKSEADVKVGRGLDGNIEMIRVSADYSQGGARADVYTSYYQHLAKAVPNKQYQRYYTFSLYNSSDNFYYGKEMDVDAVFDNSYSYHLPFSYFSSTYYTYFAVDFGKRHTLDFIRSFPIDTAYQFNEVDNVYFSWSESPDPVMAFEEISDQSNVSTDFSGFNLSYPDGWTNSDSVGAKSYVIDGFFMQSAGGGAVNAASVARSKFCLKGNFSFQIEYNMFKVPDSRAWKISIGVEDIKTSDKQVRFVRQFDGNASRHDLYVKDGSSQETLVSTFNFNKPRAGIKVARESNVFTVYYRDTEDPESSYIKIMSHQMKNGPGKEMRLFLSVESLQTSYPFVEVFWDNFAIDFADVVWGTHRDARWMQVKMLNGDGVEKTLKNVGVYSDISVNMAPDGRYNNIWEPIGPSVTSYFGDVNLALGAEVSCSSHVGIMLPENLVAGKLGATFSECWGSDDKATQWVTIHLPNPVQIYRVKIYHGYDGVDTRHIVTDYRVQISNDNVTFTNIFSISGNNSFVRVHDLKTPVSAKYVRIYITGYKSTKEYVWVGGEREYQFWYGASIRQVEVYEYYGYSVLSSEDHPIIAVDLRQRYFIEGHELVGIDSENHAIDWSNANSNFAYSPSNLSDPHKVGFGSWGESPDYEKWVAIKRNTATHYPKVPTAQAPFTDTEDFLKHVVIKASVNEYGRKPSPIEHPWFWHSSISELGYDYTKINYFSLRSLRIQYPASYTSEHVYFIEGDHFGYDEHCSWRDGFRFDLYVDDIENLDTDYGYFYLGGFDQTPQRNAVVFKWSIPGIKQVLSSGWNSLFLTFMYADDVEWVEPADPRERDPRIMYRLKFGKMGFCFRGKGKPLTLNIDGAAIERNYFSHYCLRDYGLYFHDHDMLRAPISCLDLGGATIEFFIRPDWGIDGKDSYNDFKYRSLFHLGNVANDVFGAAVSNKGMEIYYGNLHKGFGIFVVEGLYGDIIDKPIHLGFVVSNTGSGIDTSNCTIKVYMNNVPVGAFYKKWETVGDDQFHFIFGGQNLLAQKQYGFSTTSSSLDGVVSDLKIYNYCKTNFSDSLEGVPSVRDGLRKPCEFVELSDDNVTFYRLGDEALPLFFEGVEENETIPVYVRTILPRDLTGLEKRTATIIGSWDVGV